MGGSGGGGFFNQSNDITPENISKRIRDEEEKARSQSFETEVVGMLNNILTTVNNRDTESIQRHLSVIEATLIKDIEGTIDLRYSGSVSKHTYVDGLSDIDSLAIINKSELAAASPSIVKQYFFDKLKERFPKTDITNGKRAITIRFSDGIEIQILPALKTDTGVKIVSSRDESQWSKILRPDKFAKILRYVNSTMQGKLVPVIKLAKSLTAFLPENRKLAGYHMECIAIEAFKDYSGPKKTKEMLKHFFNDAAKIVLNPIKDKSGQSTHVDDYLGESNSLNRKMVSDSMSSIGRKMQNADGSKDIRMWELILK